eukprot:Mycagemm_TRINITY_DN8193_c0_g1::TRINITY_DN8193_c0_g1_i1::g.56::m.56 type:complete len:201 gc:universal TRINITY_DN8193_c0_g1_i1:78-680(+)
MLWAGITLTPVTAAGSRVSMYLHRCFSSSGRSPGSQLWSIQNARSTAAKFNSVLSVPSPRITRPRMRALLSTRLSLLRRLRTLVCTPSRTTLWRSRTLRARLITISWSFCGISIGSPLCPRRRFWPTRSTRPDSCPTSQISWSSLKPSSPTAAWEAASSCLTARRRSLLCRRSQRIVLAPALSRCTVLCLKCSRIFYSIR